MEKTVQIIKNYKLDLISRKTAIKELLSLGWSSVEIGYLMA